MQLKSNRSHLKTSPLNFGLFFLQNILLHIAITCLILVVLHVFAAEPVWKSAQPDSLQAPASIPE
jgi:hypothetical protein